MRLLAKEVWFLRSLWMPVRRKGSFPIICKVHSLSALVMLDRVDLV